MTANRFELLARSFAASTSRRAAIAGLGAAGLAATLTAGLGRGRTGAAQEPAASSPAEGWTLHIAAINHFPAAPDLVAHHYCKPVAGGLTECLLFAGDAPDAPLVGTEVIVDAQTYAEFDAEEQALWHYHKDELPLVDAKLPDLSPDEAAKVVAAIQNTYGKLYFLWDPGRGDLPTGLPIISVLHHGVPTAVEPAP